MNSVSKIEACFIIIIIIYMSTLIVCVCERERERQLHVCLSNLKYLTPKKYFAVVDLQMLLRILVLYSFVTDMSVWFSSYLELVLSIQVFQVPGINPCSFPSKTDMINGITYTNGSRPYSHV